MTPTYIEQLLGWYNDKPPEVKHKRERRTRSAMAEHLREQQAIREVDSAVNRYVYQSER